MNRLIENYINNLTPDKLNELAKSNNIILSNDELDFTYHYIKDNYNDVLSNRKLDISTYEKKFSHENFIKISNLIMKYQSYLNKYPLN